MPWKEVKPIDQKIKILLGQEYPAWGIPSETSIYNILKKEGVIATQKHRRRVAPALQPFSPVHEANDLWPADFKGQFKTKDGAWCYPLTVMDHKSRFLPGRRGFEVGWKKCNAPMESFWGTLKNELVHHRRYATRQEAIREITEHIEIFYNRQRRQKRLGYLYPAAYERRYYEKQFAA